MSLLRRAARLVGLGKEKYFKGYDLEGNSFYEFPSPNGDKSDWRQSQRTVEYLEKRHLSDYRYQSIPVQWNAWMRRTRQHPPTIQELTTDLQRMQRVQANVDRLRLEYIEEKRIQKEQELAALADVSQGREPAQRGLKGEASSALDQGPGYKIEDAVMEEVKELGSFKTDGLTVGEMEKREIGLKRRQFAEEQSRKSTATGNPSDGFKPEAWTPTSAPRRR